MKRNPVRVSELMFSSLVGATSWMTHPPPPPAHMSGLVLLVLKRIIKMPKTNNSADALLLVNQRRNKR